jgi:MFS family permease
LVGFLIFTRSLSQNRFHSQPIPETQKPQVNFFTGLRIWLALIRKIWPIYIFIFILFLVDSTYWTIGTLVSEQLRSIHIWGSLFLPAYSLPSLFIGLVISKYGRNSGKKRAAFLSAAIAGALMMFIGIITNLYILIFTVFLSSIYLAISFPEISAVFEDYVNRLGDHADDMVGLQSSAISLSYILGPVLSGILATLVGNLATFSVIGLLVLLYSLLSLKFVPKKILMPQSQMASLSPFS